jgi:hypothetical protein
MEQFFKELLKRLNSGTPAFFKKMQGVGLYLSGIGAGLIAIPNIPEILSTTGGYLLTAGAVINVLARLPIEDKTQNNS